MIDLEHVDSFTDPFRINVYRAEGDLLRGVADSFPRSAEDAIRQKWETAGRGTSTNVAQKFFMSDKRRLPYEALALVEHLNAKPFVEMLSRVYGYDLIPDPDLYGAGLHMIGRGGFLNAHIDYNWNKRLKARRRVNLLLYLNEGWQDRWGGELVLYRMDEKNRLEQALTIAPRYGTIATFETSEISYHGHPDPLECPENVFRKSLALYYYEKTDPPSNIHSTVYKGLS